ncbi:MAG: FtsX-like permease family protein [Emcibacteraceae bacterium]|nr:FtsX-like permease family protein [Emcibacteraceae bacterium]
MESFIDRHYPTSLSGDPDIKPSEEISFSSLNIKDVHLKASGFGDKKPFGDAGTVFAFAEVAVLILLIASFNFMNLSTAKATQRAKEVSLRKVMGADRKSLIIQFIGEAILLTIISLIIGLAIVEICLPYFNDIINLPLILDYGSSDLVMLFILAIMLGIFAGSYPAFILSAFHPSENLKSNNSTESKNSINFRTSLVIVQFTISITLFMATAIIYAQMQYADNYDFGFNKENTLTIRNLRSETVRNNLDVLRDQFQKTPNVTNVTTSSLAPGSTMFVTSNVRTPEMTADQSIVIDTREVGYDFFKTFDIEILNGRTYARDRNDVVSSNQLYPVRTSWTN